LLLGLCLFANKIIDADIWWHLRTGQYIVETHTIPGADMYSYTAGGNRWIDLHWLFQVVLYGAHSVLGSYGLSLLFISVFSAAFIIPWTARRRENNRLPAILFFWLALMASSARFLPRPEAFTYLMLSIYMFLLHGFEQGRCRRSIFALIPLQAIWTNMQGLFILGPFLIFAYASQAVVAQLGSRALKREPHPEQRERMWKLIAFFFGSIAACMLNPYGLEGMLFPFTLFTRAGGMENVFARSIAELQPPFSGYNLTSPLEYFGLFLALSAVALALDFRRLGLSHVIIFAGTAYLALNARRNVPVFVFAFLPLAVEHAENLVERRGSAGGGKYRRAMDRLSVACHALICMAIAFQLASVLTNRYYVSDKRAERFGFGFKEQAFPHGAFVFLKDREVRGPFFNNLDIGGMFIWEMYPAERVFIDPRLEVNSAEIFSEYYRAMSDANAFRNLSAKYRFNATIISHTSQDALYLMPLMYFSPDWVLVYFDPLAAVFVRPSLENEEIIGENAVDIMRDEIPLFSPDDTLNDGSTRLLRDILDKVASVAPSDIEAQNRFSLGLVFLVIGQHERAVEQLKAGLELMPSSPEGYYNLGLAYDRMGEKESAAQYYKRAIELDGRHASAHTNLGRIYDERELKEQAENEYRLAIKWGGDKPIPLYNLGALCYERGDREAAREYWRRALKADPTFTPASEALKNLD
jgi:tetratricopeptide (TPR) repeat protein